MKKIKDAILLLALVFISLNGLIGQENEIKVVSDPKIPNCPEWVNTAVFYQIYPQTFYDTDGDGIGDLQGIIEKLDYIQSLGVTALWLNPFFESPFCDAGYDISDYYKVAPRYGTNEDAKRLFEEAHKRGMYVVQDIIFNHILLSNIRGLRNLPNRIRINIPTGISGMITPGKIRPMLTKMLLSRDTAGVTASSCGIFTGASPH